MTPGVFSTIVTGVLGEAKTGTTVETTFKTGI